jgi:hypothetical protein
MASRVVVLSVIFVLLNLGQTEALGADWRFYAGSEFGLYHYNAENIVYLSNNLIGIWEKLILTNKGRVNLTGELGKEYENVSELVVLREMDCMGRRSRILEVAYCSEEGRIIKRESYQQFDWDSVIPDSVDDILYHVVCIQSETGTWVNIENPHLLRFFPKNQCQLKIR